MIRKREKHDRLCAYGAITAFVGLLFLLAGMSFDWLPAPQVLAVAFVDICIGGLVFVIGDWANASVFSKRMWNEIEEGRKTLDRLKRGQR